MKWISHVYTPLPSLLALFPTPTRILMLSAVTEHRAGLSVLSSRSPLSVLHVAVHIRQSQPPSASQAQPHVHTLIPYSESQFWRSFSQEAVTASVIIVFSGERGIVNRFLSHSKNLHWTNFKKKKRQGSSIIVKIKKTGYMIRKLIPSNNILISQFKDATHLEGTGYYTQYF